MVRYNKKPEFTLSTADEHSMLVKVKCHLCKDLHHYYAPDIMTLLGDIAIYDIARKFRCEKCKTREYMSADWAHVRGPDTGTVPMRRLVLIKYVRVPVWADDVTKIRGLS